MHKNTINTPLCCVGIFVERKLLESVAIGHQSSSALCSAVLSRSRLSRTRRLDLTVLGSGSISGPGSGSGWSRIRSGLVGVSAVRAAVDVLVTGWWWNGCNFCIGWNVRYGHRFDGSVQRIPVNRTKWNKLFKNVIKKYIYDKNNISIHSLKNS